jgi:arylsulfatase A
LVYILADDLGWGDLRCYNPQSAVPTPNADRLAAQGVRFTDMHSPSSVCTPTRYGILTGRYCWRATLIKGVLNGYSPNLIENGRLTVASMLKWRGD